LLDNPNCALSTLILDENDLRDDGVLQVSGPVDRAILVCVYDAVLLKDMVHMDLYGCVDHAGIAVIHVVKNHSNPWV